MSDIVLVSGDNTLNVQMIPILTLNLGSIAIVSINGVGIAAVGSDPDMPYVTLKQLISQDLMIPISVRWMNYGWKYNQYGTLTGGFIMFYPQGATPMFYGLSALPTVLPSEHTALVSLILGCGDWIAGTIYSPVFEFCCTEWGSGGIPVSKGIRFRVKNMIRVNTTGTNCY